jgi:putative iron-only hydrogenase system regulator
MKRIAVISAILENPGQAQAEFNALVSAFKGCVRGRMGIPMPEEGMAVVSIVVTGELNEINALTGKLGRIPNVNVKTSIAKKEIQES